MADSGAFEILYREYYPRVFALCRRFLLTHECAEDAAQETFARAYKSFRHYQPVRPFWHWIATIAHHHCLDKLRQAGRWEDIHAESNPDVDRLETPEPLVVDVLIAAETQAQLNAAIDALPEKYRVPLVLAYLVHLSYGEIAILLGTNRNHVGILLLRAQQQLRRCLQQPINVRALTRGVE